MPQQLADDAPDSYYRASVRERGLPAAELVGTHDVDVAIVGGGVTGCSAALHLAMRGYKVALLEAHGVGWGASGRSGGQILPDVGSGVEALLPTLGVDAARVVWGLSREGVALVSDLIDQHSIRCDLHWGSVVAATRQRHLRRLRAHVDTMRETFGYNGYQFLDQEGLLERVRSDVYCGGLYDAHAGHLHPLGYTLGLARAAQEAGAVIYESTAVQALSRGQPAQLQTARGAIRARFVALAGGAYLAASIAPELSVKIMPVCDHIVATQPLTPAQVGATLPHNDAVYDTNFMISYYHLSADRRMLFGGLPSYSGFRPQTRLWTRMTARLVHLFPVLQGAAVDYRWSGEIGITSDRAPHFGRLTPNIYFSHGYSGHGMVMGTLAGKLISEAISGQAERFDVFAQIRHRSFPGGTRMRKPLLLMATTFYRLRDLL